MFLAHNENSMWYFLHLIAEIATVFFLPNCYLYNYTKLYFVGVFLYLHLKYSLRLCTYVCNFIVYPIFEKYISITGV